MKFSVFFSILYFPEPHKKPDFLFRLVPFVKPDLKRRITCGMIKVIFVNTRFNKIIFRANNARIQKGRRQYNDFWRGIGGRRRLQDETGGYAQTVSPSWKQADYFADAGQIFGKRPV